jgi:hypothetical protein
VVRWQDDGQDVSSSLTVVSVEDVLQLHGLVLPW